MRVRRLLAVITALSLVGSGVACATTTAGRGVLADDVPTPGPTDSASPTGAPTDSPTVSPTGSPSPTASPTPTVDPVETKERATCVLVQATIRTTNDKFNAATRRNEQIRLLKTAATSIDGMLGRSGLPSSSEVLQLGRAIVGELRKIVSSAERGGNPSTTRYNTLTARFRTTCLEI
jgi:hypothetical protein